jgi:hypothetical protein
VTTSYTMTTRISSRGCALPRSGTHALGIDEPPARTARAPTYYHADDSAVVKRTSQTGAAVHEYGYDAGQHRDGRDRAWCLVHRPQWDAETGYYYGKGSTILVPGRFLVRPDQAVPRQSVSPVDNNPVGSSTHSACRLGARTGRISVRCRRFHLLLQGRSRSAEVPLWRPDVIKVKKCSSITKTSTHVPRRLSYRTTVRRKAGRLSGLLHGQEPRDTSECSLKATEESPGGAWGNFRRRRSESTVERAK